MNILVISYFLKMIKMLYSQSDLEYQRLKKDFIKQLIIEHLDLLLLGHFKKTHFSGYDAIMFIHKEFGFLLSSGTVYSTLYSMERKKLVTSFKPNNKNLFEITNEGRMLLEIVSSASEIHSEIHILMRQFMNNFA